MDKIILLFGVGRFQQHRPLLGVNCHWLRSKGVISLTRSSFFFTALHLDQLSRTPQFMSLLHHRGGWLSTQTYSRVRSESSGHLTEVVEVVFINICCVVQRWKSGGLWWWRWWWHHRFLNIHHVLQQAICKNTCHQLRIYSMHVVIAMLCYRNIQSIQQHDLNHGMVFYFECIWCSGRVLSLFIVLSLNKIGNQR